MYRAPKRPTPPSPPPNASACEPGFLMLHVQIPAMQNRSVQVDLFRSSHFFVCNHSNHFQMILFEINVKIVTEIVNYTIDWWIAF